MILKAALAQTRFMLKAKSAFCVFFILFMMVVVNFLGNVVYFQGKDVIDMCNPMRLLLLSHNRVDFNASNTIFLTEIYPLLVVCVAGFSLAKEYQRDMNVFMVSRLGNLRYIISKYIAVFLTTAIVFTIPFLLEIVLNCLSFPLEAEGNLTNLAIYDTDYLNSIDNYLMKDLYIQNIYIYSIARTIIFGIISGMFGVFTVAVSSFIKVKYNIVLFIPMLLILNLTIILDGKYFNGIAWNKYMFFFDDSAKNMNFMIIAIIILALFPIISIYINKRKDCI